MTARHLTLIVPTLNAAQYVSAFLAGLHRQDQQPDCVVILDSSSTDGSPELWSAQGFQTVSIPKGSFEHGGTRNLGARQANGTDILVFMTQDAIPADDRWLENLIAPIRSGEAVATFARQLPRPEASLLERFSRYFNYPETSRVRDATDIARLGVKAFFFSNVSTLR